MQLPPGAGTPTGTVKFSVGGRSVGTAQLVSGVATLAMPATPEMLMAPRMEEQEAVG